MFAPKTRSPPTRTVISGAVRVRSAARSTSKYSRGCVLPAPSKLRKPSESGSRTANDFASVCASVASVRPGLNGTDTLWPPFFAASSTATQPPRTIRSAIDTGDFLFLSLKVF